MTPECPDARERMRDAIASGHALVILGMNLEPLGKGKKPIVHELPDGTVEFRFRTAPASSVFIVDSNFFAGKGYVAAEAIWVASETPDV